jgi:hypothetical protein
VSLTRNVKLKLVPILATLSLSVLLIGASASTATAGGWPVDPGDPGGSYTYPAPSPTYPPTPEPAPPDDADSYEINLESAETVPVMDMTLPTVSDAQSGSVLSPSMAVGEPTCQTMSSGGAQSADITDCYDNIAPKHWWLIVTKVGSGPALVVCREWGPNNRCSSNYYPRALYRGQNTLRQFEWKDTDGVLIPAGYMLKRDQVGQNPVICVRASYGRWCKVSPRVSSYNRGDQSRFYLKR